MLVVPIAESDIPDVAGVMGVDAAGGAAALHRECDADGTTSFAAEDAPTPLSADERAGYAFFRDADGAFAGIVEEKDASDEQRRITEVNMSTYLFDAAQLLHALAQLGNENRQGEFYLTDCPGILRQEGKPVLAEPLLQPCEALSVNTLEELKTVEEEMARLGY